MGVTEGSGQAGVKGCQLTAQWGCIGGGGTQLPLPPGGTTAPPPACPPPALMYMQPLSPRRRQKHCVNKTQPTNVRETPSQPGQGPCHQVCTTVQASLAAEKLEAPGSEGMPKTTD